MKNIGALQSYKSLAKITLNNSTLFTAGATLFVTVSF